MAGFQTYLIARLLDERLGVWDLHTELRYISGIIGEVSVPVGFKTDFASVPRVPIVFDIMGNRAHAAATIHDYLYATGAVSRKTADRVFKEACMASGISKTRSWLMYAAVRMFGWRRYKK